MPARFSFFLALVALFAFAATPASAQDQDLMAYWAFNDPAPSGPAWPQPIAADAGEGTITYTFGGGVVSFAGTTINARDGAASGQSFSVQGGQALGNNGGSFTVNLSTQGYEDMVFSYATRGTASGFNRQRAEFSVDGGSTWTLIGEETNSTSTSFFLVEYDLSGFEAINNAPNVAIRVTLNGATNDTGNNRFDNIAIDGTFVGGTGGGTGTGSVALAPTLVQGGQAHDLTFTLAARSNEPADALTHFDITLPEGFGLPTGVVTEPSGGNVTFSGQMVRLSGLNATQSQPVSVTLQGVTVPDATSEYGFALRTGSNTDQTIVIASQPRLRVWGSPEPIADVKVNNAQGVAQRLGEWVSVRGVVTVADEFATGGGERGPSYLQDASGGLATFSPTGVAENVSIGDEVTLFGRVDQFNGLNQLDNQTVVVAQHGTPGPAEPTVATLAQIAADGQGGVEVYEGRLVRINGVTVNTAVWNAEGAGTNYILNDGTATLDVRINGAVDFVGQPAPSGPFDIIGVVSQFKPSAPFIGGYQLMPRFAEDILDDSDAPLVTSPAPFETAATPESVTIEWTTDRAAHSEVRWTSTMTGASGVAIDEAPKTEHALTLTGLDPAVVYEIELRTAAGKDTTSISNYYVVTRSAPGTTGVIRPLFNRSVNTELAGEAEAEVANPRAVLIQHINAAQHSVDVALYSLSGQNGSMIADALIAAHNRGVLVRVIMDNSTANTAPPTALRNAGVPFIDDSFGLNDGQPLHHNKVAIIDYRGGEPDEIWVMSGSWNPTDPGTNTHHQNIIWIQDGALAAGYTREFDQMWGSKSTTPDASQSRFGPRKVMVNPTVFWIGEEDIYTRLFFSPQGYGAWGSTERQILDALETAQHEIYLGLNLITRLSIVDVLQERFNAGIDVRGAVGEISTQGSVFNQLAAFADVHHHPQSDFGLLHHKYAIVDAEHPYANPTTITGSHNWSRSANENNDENTLIIRSSRIANQYLQEFALRYVEAGGEGPFTVDSEPTAAAGTFSLEAPYPNPLTTSTTFAYSMPEAGTVTLRVFDVMGREVRSTTEAPQGAGRYTVRFDANGLAAGVYLLQVEARAGSQVFRETQRMTVVR